MKAKADESGWQIQMSFDSETSHVEGELNGSPLAVAHCAATLVLLARQLGAGNVVKELLEMAREGNMDGVDLKLSNALGSAKEAQA